MKTNSEVLIAAYQQANRDANELTKYIESLSDPKDFRSSDSPALVENLADENSAVSRTYSNAVKILFGSGFTIAAICTSITGRALMHRGLSIVGHSLRLAIPGSNLLPLSFLAIPFAKKLLDDLKVKKYIKENHEELEIKKKKLQDSKDKLASWIINLQNQSIELEKKLQEELKIKFTEYSEKTKRFAKDVSIQIDDCLNTNTNKRIQQYYEVLLNQFKLQKDLEEKVDFLFGEYNNLLEQKKELERQVDSLVRLLNVIGCPEAVILHALGESEV